MNGSLYKALDIYSDEYIVLLFMLGTGLYGVVIYGLHYAFLAKKNIPTDNYFGVTTIGTMTSLSAVLLIFILVQSMQTYNSIKATVGKEIISAELLHEVTTFLPRENSADINSAIKDYLITIHQYGWKLLPEGKRSDETDIAFQRLLDAVQRLAMNKTVPTELTRGVMSGFHEMVKNRYERLLMARQSVAPIFYFGVLILITLHVTQFFFLTRRNLYSLFILSLHLCALGVLLGLTYSYSHPFEGTTSVQADEYLALAAKINP
jgi:hypothetical protein